MSGLEVAGFLIGVAGLFSSCVDAFNYFKLAQHADRDIEVALVKLDIEKTRLLIWGEKVAVFSATNPSPRLTSVHAQETLPSVLEAVYRLLTDSEALRATYGVQILTSPNPSSPFGKAVDYISAKSVAAFRSAGRQYWIRKATTGSALPQRGTVVRTKWAVYERDKFQHLINNLKHFIDTLYELTGVGREAQDEEITESITTILDVSRLAIIEEATEDSYSTYAETAATTRALTESGTVDLRPLEERLSEVEGVEDCSQDRYLQTDGLDSFHSELAGRSLCFALTSTCRRLSSQNVCDIRQLGLDCISYYEGKHLAWNVSSANPGGGNALWQLIRRAVDVRKPTQIEEFSVLGEILKLDEDNLNDAQKAYLTEGLPLTTLYIYCAPCVCLIHTALAIAGELNSGFINIRIRPDDRLPASCCVNSDRALGLRSALEEVREWEATAAHNTKPTLLVSFLDTVWLQRRLDHLDYETPYSYHETFRSQPETQILVLGEADYLGPFVQKAPGRIPVAMDIWCWPASFQLLDCSPLPPGTRTFFGRFIESRFSASSQPSLTNKRRRGSHDKEE